MSDEFYGFDDPDFGVDESDGGCPYCGGDGFTEGECECLTIESICCCLYPKPPVCPHCGGNG